MRSNGNRHPEEILDEIERTRSHMDHTLHEIERKLSPGELVDQGIAYLRNSGGSEFVNNLGRAARNNPLPVALVGVGLAWLMAADRSRSMYGYSADYSSGSTTSEMKERASGMASSAKESLSSSTQAARDTWNRTSQSAKDSWNRTSESARHQMERMRGSYDHLVHEQPLALGAIGLAVGALFAAMTPRTRKEDELMGAAAERVKEQVKEAGQEQIEKAKSVATAAKDAAKEETKRQSQSTSASSPSTASPASSPGVRREPGPPGRSTP